VTCQIFVAGRFIDRPLGEIVAYFHEPHQPTEQPLTRLVCTYDRSDGIYLWKKYGAKSRRRCRRQPHTTSGSEGERETYYTSAIQSVLYSDNARFHDVRDDELFIEQKMNSDITSTRWQAKTAVTVINLSPKTCM